MPFDPDKYLMEKGSPFDPDAYLKEKSGSVSKDAALKNGQLATAGNKFAQGASFGFVDELGGGMEALGSLAGLRGLGGQITDIHRETPDESRQGFSDIYRQRRDQNRERQKGESAAYPKTALASELAGGLTTGLAGGGGLAGAALDGGFMGLGNSEADLTKGDFAGAAKDTAIGAGIGAGTAGLSKGLGKVSDKIGLTDLAERAVAQPLQKGYDALTDRFPAYLKDFAEKRAAKAAIGQNQKLFNKLNAQKAENGTGVNKLGRDLLSEDEAGAPAVGWLSRSEDIKPIVDQKRKFFGGKIGEVGDTAEQVLGQKPVQGTDIGDNILNWSAKNIPEGSPFNTVRNKMLEHADSYSGNGNLGWKDAQNLKNNLKYDHTVQNDVGKEGINALNRSVSDAMDATVGRASSSTAATPEQLSLLNSYQTFKDKAGSYINASEGAKQRGIKNLSNRLPSPSDLAVGGLLGTSNYLGGDQSDPLRSLAIGAAGIGANRFARTRGSAFAAKSSDAIADFINSGSSQAAKYGPYLQKLLQEKGPKEAGLALYLLLKNDPSYKLTEGTPQ